MKPFYIITRTALYDDHRFCLEEIFLDIDKKKQPFFTLQLRSLATCSISVQIS